MNPISWLPMIVAAVAISSAGFGHAQTGATGMHNAENESMMVESLNISVYDIKDMAIYMDGGDEVGDDKIVGGVEEVLVDESGEPVAVLADVGEFLAVDEKFVVIKIDQLTMKMDNLTVTMSEDQIEALPEFEDNR